MLKQAVEFRAEVNELRAQLVALHDGDWELPTQFKQWTVNDIVRHLHESDLFAAASAAGPEPFGRLQAEIQALRDSGMTRVQVMQQRFGHLTGKPLLEQWFATAQNLADELSELPADRRLTWFGPDMGLRMFTTARLMETWAHGQAIFDLMGAEREPPTDRLRNIAEIGTRTYGWTFANRGMATPGPAPYVRLVAPGDAVWEWNDPSIENRVDGPALAFCQVVTQVRNFADTPLTVKGNAARTWMNLAQCFAGPPENPPPAGTRFKSAPTG